MYFLYAIRILGLLSPDSVEAVALHHQATVSINRQQIAITLKLFVKPFYSIPDVSSAPNA